MKFLVVWMLLLIASKSPAQTILDAAAARQLALSNQAQLKAGQLGLRQQELLRGSAAQLANPQLFGEITPFEPLLVGVQQNFYWPTVYRQRTLLQNQRIRLAELQLQSTTLLLKQGVSNAFIDLQYQQALLALQQRQDSVQQALATTASRFFTAGQINKLEELQTQAAAAQVRNSLRRTEENVRAAQLLLGFYLRQDPDTLYTTGLDTVLVTTALGDSLPANTVQQALLNQQISLAANELSLTRAELLPQLQAGFSLPVSNNYERLLGFQVGIGLPIFRRQNRAAMAAAKTGIEVAEASTQLETQRLRNQYAQALINYRRDLMAVRDYQASVLPKADSLVTTAQRLFAAGQLNYTETLRNVQQAYELYAAYLDLLRSQQQQAITLQYLTGTL